ncbi:hypothetical protein PIB30_060494 [Stylosanthes scabra]|uniref:Uncharacterized protein n=1 Tax=Stylosanthes scabra TaxID=79078 RepID=A0ABU6VKC8_9FABA|nr:hypothetical protein [Stylosanthes scabra]
MGFSSPYMSRANPARSDVEISPTTCGHIQKGGQKIWSLLLVDSSLVIESIRFVVTHSPFFKRASMEVAMPNAQAVVSTTAVGVRPIAAGRRLFSSFPPLSPLVLALDIVATPNVTVEIISLTVVDAVCNAPNPKQSYQYEN